MKLSSIPKIYRNVNRWTEIITVLSKYGLADWLSRVPLDFAQGLIKGRDGEILAKHTQEARIRMALADLGPTFIKLGQILSTRPDIVGVDLVSELKRLQSDAPADPPDVVVNIIREELGQPVEEIFEQFHKFPIASASIGQVHRARLKTGKEVVVKVQHAGIESKVHEDLEILAGMAQLAQHLPEFAPYRPVETVAEFQRALRRELNFGREERNLRHFSMVFSKDPCVRIPRPHVELCTPRVLTMELLDGIKLSETEMLRDAGFDLEEVARRGAELYLRMIFTDGAYHADPHPGNIILMKDGVIGLLDFGNVGRIDERLREDIEEMLLAIINQDPEHLTMIITRVGKIPSGDDESALTSDIADFVSHYGSQAMDKFNLSSALNELIEIIRRYDIILPIQVAMLIKVLITLEGTARLLSPKFNLMEIIKPYRHEIMLRRMSPARQAKKLRRLYTELERVVEVMPGRFMDIVEQVRTGKFDVHLDHRGLKPSINRLVMGMLTSAIFLGSSLMLSHKVPPLLFSDSSPLGLHRISIAGLSGVLLSIVLGLRLLWAIRKSGNLDQRE